jgi:hypothetical protein
VEISKKFSRKCGVFFLSSGDFPSLMRVKLSIIASRLSKSLEDAFAMILRSIVCAFEPVLFCTAFF